MMGPESGLVGGAYCYTAFLSGNSETWLCVGCRNVSWKNEE